MFALSVEFINSLTASSAQGKTPTLIESLGYDVKPQSRYLWTSNLQLLLIDLLRPVMVIPVRFPTMDQIYSFGNYKYCIEILETI